MTIMLFRKKKRAALVDEEWLKGSNLSEKLDILRDEVMDQRKTIETIEKKVEALREFASEQVRGNNIEMESIERLIRDVDALKCRTD